MKQSRLDNLYFDIIQECLKLIYNKNIDIDELSFQMGMSYEDLVQVFKTRNKDFSIYLKAYDLLCEW